MTTASSSPLAGRIVVSDGATVGPEPCTSSKLVRPLTGPSPPLLTHSPIRHSSVRHSQPTRHHDRRPDPRVVRQPKVLQAQRSGDCGCRPPRHHVRPALSWRLVTPRSRAQRIPAGSGPPNPVRETRGQEGVLRGHVNGRSRPLGLPGALWYGRPHRIDRHCRPGYV